MLCAQCYFVDGVLTNVDQQRYYLEFEVIPYNERIKITESRTEVVRGRPVDVHFRNWAYVPNEDLMGAKVWQLKDEKAKTKCSRVRI